MTPDERKLILSLVISPRNTNGGDPAAVLRHFGTTDGPGLGRSLLAEAIRQKDAMDVELALIACARFGCDETLLPLLLELAPADWHRKHEDVVSMPGKLRAPESVDALYLVTQWFPNTWTTTGPERWRARPPGRSAGLPLRKPRMR